MGKHGGAGSADHPRDYEGKHRKIEHQHVKGETDPYRVKKQIEEAERKAGGQHRK